MRDRDLYQQILGLSHPWHVVDIRLSLADRHVVVVAGYAAGEPLACPTYGRACGRHDHRKRQ